MRLLIDSLIALILVAILGAVLVHYRDEQAKILRRQLVHQALSEMQEEAIVHGALDEVETNDAKFPLDVLEQWFDNGVPRNVFALPGCPWLDIAPPEDHSDQPPDPVIHQPTQAGFWYNPNRGIFRARVAAQFTEQATLDLYNQLNSTSLRVMPRPSEPYPTTHPAGMSRRKAEEAQASAAKAQAAAKPRRTLLDHDPDPLP